MNPQAIIDKYYLPNSNVWKVLVEHSMAVANKAVSIAKNHPELSADSTFIYEAAMLHDIGIYMTDAHDLFCFGSFPYISHGYLGRDLLDKEGFPIHALVCERHTGTGLSIADIETQNLPIPHRSMLPVSIEEQIICFADKFYSKSGQLDKAKSIDKIRKSLNKHGAEQLMRFDAWCEMFL